MTKTPRNRHLLLIPLVAATLGVASSVRAQTTNPQFFFAKPGTTPTSYTQGLTSQSVAANGNVTLSIWYQFQPTVSATYFGMDVFIGFDQAVSEGVGATPQNGTVTLPSGLTATSAITNVNPIFTDLSNTLGGGQDPSNASSPSSAVRPYGDDIFLASTSISGFSAPGSLPLHLFDITLHNTALGAGGSQSTVIYSNDPAGKASDFTTYLDDGKGDPSTFTRPGASVLLNLFQPTSGTLPEPDSIALLTASAATLLAAGFTRRQFGKITRRC